MLSRAGPLAASSTSTTCGVGPLATICFIARSVSTKDAFAL